MEQLLAELRALRAEVAGATLPQALDYERAARELSVSVSQLRKLIRSGEIAIIMVGRRPKVPASEVRRLCQVKAAPALPRSTVKQYGGTSSAKTEAQKTREMLRSRRRAH